MRSCQSASTPGGVGAPPVYTFVSVERSAVFIASLLRSAMNAVTADTVNVARCVAASWQASEASNR